MQIGKSSGSRGPGRGTKVLLAAGALSAAVLGLALTAGPASAAKVKRPDWKACGTFIVLAPTAKCAVFTVPQDYSRPRGATFRLAMVKIPATGKKRGSLFFNPGGPGGSGLEFVFRGGALGLPQSIRRHFDFVTWDPRGVGLTRPAIRRCESSDSPTSPLPDTGNATDEDWLEFLDLTRQQNLEEARQCMPLNRGFTRYMGTRNVVRDLDRMRAAVGDRRLTFWGGSYGTRIGYVYSLLYPDRLRAILLDGSVNPEGGFPWFGRVRAQATDRALEVIRQVRPAFGDRIIATRDDLRINGPVGSGEGKVTQWDFEGFISVATFSQAEWTSIRDVMDAIDEARSNSRRRSEAMATLREELDRLEERPFFPEVGAAGPADDGMMLRIINHLDYADSTIPADEGRAMVLENVRDYPFASGPTSAFFATASAGIGFLKPDPVPSTSNPKMARRAGSLDNVLISGSTGDGATPFIWSEEMAGAFSRAAFIQYEGWQHVNWTRIDSSCVNDRITHFILTGRKPSPFRPPLCPFAPPGPPAVPIR